MLKNADFYGKTPLAEAKMAFDNLKIRFILT